MVFTRQGKIIKKKTFISNELKQTLFIAFSEARKYKTYITPEILLYILLSNTKCFASRIISTTFTQFKNNKNITSQILADQILLSNKESFTVINKNITTGFSLELSNENQITPWLSTETKILLKKSFQFALKTKKKIVILTTKDLLFELLNKESVRDSLRQLASD